jgi:flagellar motor switch protein FliN/FliY
MPSDATHSVAASSATALPVTAPSGNVSQEAPKNSESSEAGLQLSKEAGAEADRIVAAMAEITSPESALGRMPLQLDVMVPIPRFRVEDLLALEKGRVLETAWVDGDDLPVRGGGIQLVWSEFEVVEQKLAVRVTRLV